MTGKTKVRGKISLGSLRELFSKVANNKNLLYSIIDHVLLYSHHFLYSLVALTLFADT